MVAKFTLVEFPTSVLAFLRFFLAFLLLLPFITLGGKKEKFKKSDIPLLVLCGLLLISFHIFLFFEGVKLTFAIDASALFLTIPILSVLAGWWFLKEKTTLVNIIGIGVGLGGALLVADIPLVLLGLGSAKSTLGNILILLSSVSFVAGAVISKKLLDRYSVVMVLEGMFLVGFLTFLPIGVFESVIQWGWWKNISFVGVFGLVYMTLLSSVSAYFLFEWGVKKVGVVKADLFQYIEPAVAASLALPLLGERISFSFIVGTCLVVLGVYWGTYRKPHHHHRHLRASRG